MSHWSRWPRWLKWSMCASLLTVGVVIAAAMTAAWPLHFYPVTEIEIHNDRSQPIVARTPTLASGLLEKERGLSEKGAYPLAGVAERDITPPIGLPKFGYSAWSKTVTGFRTHLKARAFYVESSVEPVKQRESDEKGRAFAIVQTDLGSGSLLLHHAVAERTARETPIGLANLSITSTHTHSGPGQYFASDFYNIFGSHRAGFDPKLFDFLVQQISDAVIEAYQTREEATIATGVRSVYGLTKNRSIGAYLNNRDEPLSGQSDSEAQARMAVNPRMTMLRIDHRDQNGQFKPKGILTSFAIHGTGIGANDSLYHADVWSQFSRQLAWKTEQHYQTHWVPVHGPFIANHADNNPAYLSGKRGVDETDRIGAALAEEAWHLLTSLDDQRTQAVEVGVATLEIDLLAPQREAHKRLIEPLCERALVGTAVVAGANGDEVFPTSYLFPFKEGHPHNGAGHGCHQQKRVMLSSLQAAALAPERFPRYTYFQMLRMNDHIMFNTPFEVTFEAGNRIEQAIQTVLNEQMPKVKVHEVKTISVNSLANGYTGYATTREEYALQWYEGGHTLYGPGTVAYIRQVAAYLTEKLLTSEAVYSDLPSRWAFNLRSSSFFPEPEPEPADQPYEGVRQLISTPEYIKPHHGKHEDSEGPFGSNFWMFEYQGEGPYSLALHQPLLSIEHRSGDASWAPLYLPLYLADVPVDVPVDDQSGAMALEQIGGHGAHARYRASWYVKEAHLNSALEYRFKVEARESVPVFYSPPFSVDQNSQ